MTFQPIPTRVHLPYDIERTIWPETRPCLECNPLGIPARPEKAVQCPCGGSGWNRYAALATSPWSEIIPGLWIGGHEYVRPGTYGGYAAPAHPRGRFEVVVSAYQRKGYAPHFGVKHHEFLFPDATLTPEALTQANSAAEIIAEAVSAGESVLSRCQAGLNRSSLMAGLAMVKLGFAGPDAVQLIRAKRSPWALCNEEYAAHIEGLSAGSPTVSTHTGG